MNKPRKESALKKYSGLSKEDVLAALPTDEKAYTPDEQEEIIEALFSGNTTQQPAPSNPIADALKDLAYHGRIEGEQFRNYHKWTSNTFSRYSKFAR